MTDLSGKKNKAVTLTIANLCCLTGFGLITCGAFMLHTAAGCMTAGVFAVLIGVSVRQGLTGAA